MINRILVANRGEIARRVFATCRRLGIETVAVFSEADADLPFVAEADHAVRLPGSAPADTYLRIDLIVEAARKSGADAVHPGYGFLSENADFVRAVVAAGLTWIGPPADAIELMGNKVRAKEIAAEAGVPVLSVTGEPTAADLPLLVKASAGGGGRGMRIVDDLTRLPGEIEAAKAEALSAFGDGAVFVEPYVEAGRHVELQILSHAGGTDVLGSRDCSVQRRHQKVIEEAPAPDLPAASYGAMADAAAALADGIGYLGAGTVEYLFDPATGRFYFLEMNTRLQVEHPVTELTNGLDLVELQIAVAQGQQVDLSVDESPGGHAIEARLYAEDAAYTPQSGTLVSFDIPADTQFDALPRAGVRVDAGFTTGDSVGTHYDAMLAKVIAWAPSRPEAIRMLTSALRRARLHGVVTNRDQLVEILQDPTFASAQMTTTWLESREASTPEVDRLAVIAAGLAVAAQGDSQRQVQQGVPTGWRNVVSQSQRIVFEGQAPVEWLGARGGYVVAGVEVLDVSATRVRLAVDGVVSGYDVRQRDRDVWVDSASGSLALRQEPRFTDPGEAIAPGSLLAPMPGTVVRMGVEEGAQVLAGDVILVLEAMKMQHTVTAPHDGMVAELHTEPGAQVAAGEVLARMKEME